MEGTIDVKSKDKDHIDFAKSSTGLRITNVSVSIPEL